MRFSSHRKLLLYTPLTLVPILVGLFLVCRGPWGHVGHYTEAHPNTARPVPKVKGAGGLAKVASTEPGMLHKLAATERDFGWYEDAIMDLESEIVRDGASMTACIEAVKQPGCPTVARILLLGLIGRFADSTERTALARWFVSQGEDALLCCAALRAALMRDTNLPDEASRRRFWKLWYYLNAMDLAKKDDAVFAQFESRNAEFADPLRGALLEAEILGDARSEDSALICAALNRFAATSPIAIQRFLRRAPSDGTVVERVLALLGEPNVASMTKTCALSYLSSTARDLATSPLEEAILRETDLTVISEAATHLSEQDDKKVGTLLALRYWSVGEVALKMKIVELLAKSDAAWDHVRRIATSEANAEVRRQVARALGSPDFGRSSTDARREILELLCRDPDESVRVCAVYSLALNASDVTMRRLLEEVSCNDPSERIRISAKEMLDR